MFDRSSIVLDTQRNSYFTYQLNTLKNYHQNFFQSVDIVDLRIFMLYKVQWRHNRCGMHATE